ncbi:hypothetical protein [Desulfovibrio piger]|uniref:hypothetical protein n=1 Tax=Desulfovibrio piger TaxID=901 RepID=UPI0039F61566
MHRIDHETATSDHKFTEGNPTIPVPATVVTDDWLNAVQEELVAVITGAGLELEKSDNTQLWQAITTAVDNALPGLATTKNPGLVQIGDGLAITPQGLLSVVIASTSQAGLVKPRYGLKIGKDGSLDVDFGDMPTDKFEALLKSIRVPIWLTKDKDFYVNATTGSDTLDEGRGESEEKPFKTIQACASYVCDNYNVSRYTLTVHIAPGTYAPFSLGGYSRSTGRIVFEGPAPKFAKDFPVIIEGMDKTLVAYSGAEPFYFRNIKYRENMTPAIGRFAYIIGGSGTGLIYLDRFFIEINLSGEFTEAKFFRTIYTTAGTVYLQNSSPDDKSYIEVNGHPDTSLELVSGIFCSYTRGHIQILGAASDEVADIVCAGRSTNFAYAGGGLISRNIGYTYRMRFSGTYTGRRYVAVAGGKINTERAGAEYFPGTGPGTVEADTYSWYK